MKKTHNNKLNPVLVDILMELSVVLLETYSDNRSYEYLAIWTHFTQEIMIVSII